MIEKKKVTMRQIVKLASDKCIIKVYDESGFVTKGNWFEDNILDYMINKSVLFNMKFDVVKNEIIAEKVV